LPQCSNLATSHPKPEAPAPKATKKGKKAAEPDDDDDDEETLDSVDNDAYELGCLITNFKDLMHDAPSHVDTTRQQDELVPHLCRKCDIPEPRESTVTDWTHFRRMHVTDQLLLEVIILQYTRKLSARYADYTPQGLDDLIASRDPAIHKIVLDTLMSRMKSMLYNIEVKANGFSNGDQFTQDKCLYRYWKEVVTEWKKANKA